MSPSALRKKGGYLFLAVVFLVFLQGGFLTGIRRAVRPVPSPAIKSEKAKDTWHPIPGLMDAAEARFRSRLRRQSRTLAGAVEEYKRRYGRDPPLGFDGWWDFARRNGVVMLDEYDTVNEDLAPFRRLSGADVRHRARAVSESLESVSLVQIVADNRTVLVTNLHPEFKDKETGARARNFATLVRRFVKDLPKFPPEIEMLEFPVNGKAEGRVVVPWRDESDGDAKFVLEKTHASWDSGGNVWDSWRRTCPPGSPARRVLSALRKPNSSSPFLSFTPIDASKPLQPTFSTSVSASTLNFCASPADRFDHGHFFSDWRTLSVLVPIFSPGRASGFSDIRVPSHYYYSPTPRYTYGWDPVVHRETENDKMEVPWEEKEDRVYWRGATTGGGSHPPGWTPGYQRHRFVRLASTNSSSPTVRVTFPDPASVVSEKLPPYVTLPIPLSDLNEDLMDVAFVTSVGHYPGGNEALHASHRFADAVPLGAHWRYKYLADIDGMGYSGRFLALLASGSVPLKATVYEEWWRDWLEPWLHFIPLSSSYTEIYDIYAYFSGPSQGMVRAWRNATDTADVDEESMPQQGLRHVEGDRRLKRIAKAGQQWKRTMGRRVDMDAYVYRLVLEWARICADDREAMSFKL